MIDGLGEVWEGGDTTTINQLSIEKGYINVMGWLQHTH